MTTTERSFGEINFGGAKLGNSARTRRLVKLADMLVGQPGGTLPQKIRDPAALQAMYRLVKRREVTHASVLAPHLAETRRRIEQHSGPLLAICDSSELDYSGLESVEELGQIGNGGGRGFICHNVLIFNPEKREVLGLGNQILHIRDKTPEDETKSDRRDRESRESRLWPEATKDLPKISNLIVVCDRGGDTFEELEHEMKSGRKFVIRSAQDRNALMEHVGDSEVSKLHTLARQAKAVGTFRFEVAAAGSRPSRKATMQYAFMPVRLLPPKQPRGVHSQEPLTVWVVRVWEKNPPAGTEGLEWLLLTSMAIADAAATLSIIDYYKCRWVIEEYHKASKTGCSIEEMQFTYRSRLEAMIALQSVIALTLLNLREMSRRPDAETTAASEVVSQEAVNILSIWRHGDECPDWTIAEFFYALARLGGHQNRRQDKQPGWMVLWRGWMALQLLIAGAKTQRKRKKLD